MEEHGLGAETMTTQLVTGRVLANHRGANGCALNPGKSHRRAL